MNHTSSDGFLKELHLFNINNGKDTLIVIRKEEILSLALMISEDEDDGHNIEIITKSCGTKYVHFIDKYSIAKEWFRIMKIWQNVYTIDVQPTKNEIDYWWSEFFGSRNGGIL